MSGGKTLANGLKAIKRKGVLVTDELIDQINDALEQLATTVEPGTQAEAEQPIPGVFVVGNDPEKNDGDDGGAVINVGGGNGGGGGEDLTAILQRLAALESCFPLVSSVTCDGGTLEVEMCNV